MNVPTTIAADVLVDAAATLGEGPVWDPDGATVLWVDILGRRVLSTALDGGTDVICETPSDVGAVARREAGGLILVLVDGFWALGSGARSPTPFARHVSRPGVRFNDAKVDPAGRLVAGTMAYTEEPGSGELVRLEIDATITPLIPKVTISNGLGWSPDGRTMYYVDTATQRVDAFDYASGRGEISRRRPFVTLPRGEGAPDGLAVDAEGAIWVALWGGGRVHRYLPDGRLAAVVTVPATNSTSCAFVGPDLDRLVITSARTGLPDDRLAAEPHAGALFIASPDVPGLAVPAFGG
jgi:sugar lactone lactonase YvrE